METVSLWGEGSSSLEATFLHEECLALLRGQVHLVDENHPEPLCPHIRRPESADYSLCIHMMAQRDALGILHLQCSRNDAVHAEVDEGKAEVRPRFTSDVAEQIAARSPT